MFNSHGGYSEISGAEGSNVSLIADYSININPFGVSELLKRRLTDRLDSLENYPEIDGKSSRKRLSAFINIPEENLILGNGATELIYLFAKSMDLNGRRVGIFEPTFTEYEKAAGINGADIVKFTDEGGLLDALSAGELDFVFVCSPNNPTGKLFGEGRGGIEVLLRAASEGGASVFLDESFIEFSGAESAEKFVSECDLFILKSVTKIYGIPGIRIGYGVGNEKIVERMNFFKEPWTVNSLALEVLDSYIEDEEYMKRTKEWYASEKDSFFKVLSSIEGMKVFPSEANFFMIELENADGRELREYCLKRGFYIRLCDDFYSLSSRYIRLAVRFREQNEALVLVLREFFQEKRDSDV